MHGCSIPLERHKQSADLTHSFNLSLSFVQIPKPDVVLVSSEVLPVEMDNLLEVPWDLAILDVRCVTKGNAARLASAVAQTKCSHFVIANEMPSSETALMNTLRLIDARQSVRPLIAHHALSDCCLRDSQIVKIVMKRVTGKNMPFSNFRRC